MNVALVSVPSSSVKELGINNVIRKLCSSDLNFLCAPILPLPQMICLSLQCSFLASRLNLLNFIPHMCDCSDWPSSVGNGHVILKFDLAMLSVPHWFIRQLNLREPVFPGSETCCGAPSSILQWGVNGGGQEILKLFWEEEHIFSNSKMETTELAWCHGTPVNPQSSVSLSD